MVTLEKIGQFLIKLKMNLTCELLLGVHPRQIQAYTHTKICVQIFTKSLFMLAKKSNIFTMNEWIGKQIGIHLYKGTLLSNKMEKITDAHNHINESEKHYTKWKSSTHKASVLNNFAEAKGPKPVLGTEEGDCIHRSTSSVYVVKEMPCVFHLWWLVDCVLFVRSYEL